MHGAYNVKWIGEFKIQLNINRSINKQLFFVTELQLITFLRNNTGLHQK